MSWASSSEDPTGSDDTDDPDGTPSNSALIAVMTSNAETVSLGEEVTLDASEYSDPVDDNLSYEWELTALDGSSTELNSEPW